MYVYIHTCSARNTHTHVIMIHVHTCTHTQHTRTHTRTHIHTHAPTTTHACTRTYTKPILHTHYLPIQLTTTHKHTQETYPHAPNTQTESSWAGSVGYKRQTEAIESMKAKLAKDLGITKEQVIVSDIELVIVDGALVDNVPSGQYLAWRASTSVLNDATSISTSYLSEDGQRVLSSLPFVRGITADPFVCDLQVDVATPGYVLPPGVTMDINKNQYVNISAG